MKENLFQEFDNLVGILEVDSFPWKHFLIPRSRLHPPLDAGHLTNFANQFGDLGIGGHHLGLEKVLGAEEEEVQVRPGQGVPH